MMLNRRIRRTKALLRHGLAQLMSEKSVNEVTVKELVDLVDINRSTFYLHYTDIYNMLESVEDELFDEILHTIRTHPVSPFNKDSFPFIEDIFAILFDNREICAARSFSRADGQSEIHLCLLRGRRRGPDQRLAVPRM